MTPTSEERREVAERLRSGIVARNIPEAYVAIVQSIGVRPCLLLHDGESGDRFDRSAYEAALNRLADLIDPTCHLGPAHFGGFGCDRCFTWFPDMKKRTSYCPGCGARVVTGDDR